MFISFPRAAKALLFLPNGVLSATAPAPIVCISVRRETVSIVRPSGALDLRRPTDIATLYHADPTRTLHGFRLRIESRSRRAQPAPFTSCPARRTRSERPP